MQTRVVRLISLVTIVAIGGFQCIAAEENVDRNHLPKEIASVLGLRFPEGKVISAVKETENGQVVYDIELEQNGRKFESDIKADGTILEVESEIAQKDWPKPLINEVMEVAKVAGKKETPDHYEVTLTMADKKSKEVIASLDGKTITEETAQ